RVLRAGRGGVAGPGDRPRHHALPGSEGAARGERAGHGDDERPRRRGHRAARPAAGARLVRVGVLALQGDFDAHRRRLAELGAEATLVRSAPELAEVDALVIPGGESTTLLKLM